jgi:hypothetical protein
VNGGVSDHLGLNEYEGDIKELEKNGKGNSWSPQMQDHIDDLPGLDGVFTEDCNVSCVVVLMMSKSTLLKHLKQPLLLECSEYCRS